MSGTEGSLDSTHLALDRTWLAHERTLMAWVRTAISMISFAFTIYKFFQFEAGRGAPATRGWFTPREFAMVLAGIALFTLVAATIGHRRDIKVLAPHFPGRHSMSELAAVLVSLFGLTVLLSAWFHK